MSEVAPTSPEPDLSGHTLDRYRLIRQLGVGGMGAVYEAEHTILEKRFALKMLRHELTAQEIARKRFLREAKAASKVRHPNVVDISDFGQTAQGHAYFVMELLEGRDLRQLVDMQQRLPWDRTRNILLQVTSALDAAHSQGIIHRDMKPSNCFLVDVPGMEGQDVIKVLDFGIAKFSGTSGDIEGLTSTDEMFGTVAYMAPEMVLGVKCSPSSDIYAVGIMMYRMLTGEVPFRHGTAFQVLSQHVNQPPAPPRSRHPSIPAAIEAIILKALEKDPKNRFRSMNEFGAAIRRGSLHEGAEFIDTAPTMEPIEGTVVLEEYARATPDIIDATKIRGAAPSDGQAPSSVEPPSDDERTVLHARQRMVIAPEPVVSPPATSPAPPALSAPPAPAHVQAPVYNVGASAPGPHIHAGFDGNAGGVPPPLGYPRHPVHDGSTVPRPPSGLSPALPTDSAPLGKIGHQPTIAVAVVVLLIAVVGGGVGWMILHSNDGEGTEAKVTASDALSQIGSRDPVTVASDPAQKARGGGNDAPPAATSRSPEQPPIDQEASTASSPLPDPSTPEDGGSSAPSNSDAPAEAQRPPRATSKAQASKSHNKETRTDAQIVKALEKKVSRKCKHAGSTMVKVEGLISTKGQVVSPLVSPSNAQAKCVRDVVKKERFAPSKKMRPLPPFTVHL